jgi:hypothetical protein
LLSGRVAFRPALEAKPQTAIEIRERGSTDPS